MSQQPKCIAVHLTAAQLSIQLPANACERAVGDGPSMWALFKKMQTRMKLLVLAWPNPCCIVYLRSEPPDERSHTLPPLSVNLDFQINTHLKNFKHRIYFELYTNTKVIPYIHLNIYVDFRTHIHYKPHSSITCCNTELQITNM